MLAQCLRHFHTLSFTSSPQSWEREWVDPCDRGVSLLLKIFIAVYKYWWTRCLVEQLTAHRINSVQDISIASVDSSVWLSDNVMSDKSLVTSLCGCWWRLYIYVWLYDRAIVLSVTENWYDWTWLHPLYVHTSTSPGHEYTQIPLSCTETWQPSCNHIRQYRGLHFF